MGQRWDRLQPVVLCFECPCVLDAMNPAPGFLLPGAGFVCVALLEIAEVADGPGQGAHDGGPHEQLESDTLHPSLPDSL